MINLMTVAPVAPTLHLRMRSIVLFYIFLALPLFDMVNGFLIGQGYSEAGSLASPSQIGRFLGIVLLLAASIKLEFSKYFISALLLTCLLETAFFFRHNNFSGLVVGYVYVSRFLYMYLLYVFFSRFFAKDLAPLIKFLKYNVGFVCGSVIVASWTGLANSTYGWGEGTKGFFASGNGLGIYVGAATLILAAMKKYRVYCDVHPFMFVLSAYTLTLLGTKTSLLMFVLVVFAAFWAGRMRFIIVPAIVLAVIRFSEEIYARLSLQYDIILQRYENSRTLSDYLLSNRNVYAESAWSEFTAQNPDILRWLFGGGAFLSFQNPYWVRQLDILETDVLDLLFMYGIVGVVCYGVFMFYSVRPFLRSAWMLLPVIVLWGHSVIAGHVLFNGLGATLMVLLLAIGVTLNDMRRIDGIKLSSAVRALDRAES